MAGAPSEAELREAYAGKRVLVTGHTGFKGSWLCHWLHELGAEVFGYALPPDTSPSLFERARVEGLCQGVLADLNEGERLRGFVREVRPHYVFHLAAQPLVRRSYEEPLQTLQTNVLGTARLLEALRLERHPCATVVVTSDKCYENREWVFGYREEDPMGGHDVYSMSKGAAELLVSSWRRSFFPPARLAEHGMAVATARAGNVIGGGDWGRDRIVPDCIGALAADRPIAVRNPLAVRPWQHVLEPLGGYLLLGARLAGVGTKTPAAFCEGWNFGPRAEACQPVRRLVETLIEAWGGGRWEDQSDPSAHHEATLLRLSIDKAHARLGWSPRWSFEEAIARTAAWYRAHHQGGTDAELEALTRTQIRDYLRAETEG